MSSEADRRAPNGSAPRSAKFGLVNGMGSAGREYIPGVIHALRPHGLDRPL